MGKPTQVQEQTVRNVHGNARRLVCCSCGATTRGRQWWNRDTGYGLCESCADSIPAKHHMSADEMKRSYGVRGVHYALVSLNGSPQ